MKKVQGTISKVAKVYFALLVPLFVFAFLELLASIIMSVMASRIILDSNIDDSLTSLLIFGNFALLVTSLFTSYFVSKKWLNAVFKGVSYYNDLLGTRIASIGTVLTLVALLLFLTGQNAIISFLVIFLTLNGIVSHYIVKNLSKDESGKNENFGNLKTPISIRYLLFVVIGFLLFPVLSWISGQLSDQLYYSNNAGDFSVCRDINPREFMNISEFEQGNRVKSLLNLPDWLTYINVMDEFSRLNLDGNSYDYWDIDLSTSYSSDSMTRTYVYKSSLSSLNLTQFIENSVKLSKGYDWGGRSGSDMETYLNTQGKQELEIAEVYSKEKLSQCMSNIVVRQANLMDSDGNITSYLIVEIEKAPR